MPELRVFRPEVGRGRPAALRALGLADPPAEVAVAGRLYQREEIYKHDSWAATAVYRAGQQRILCKFNRQQPLLGLPMRWLGRWLARREMAALARLHDVPGIPRLAGNVRAEGRLVDTALAREFIAGEPLHPRLKLPARFFDRLQALLSTLHRRGMAYVDLHKRENLLVDGQGQPVLIDFQVCFLLPRRSWVRFTPLRTALRLLQQADRYHLLKHRLKLEAGSTRVEAVAAARPFWLRCHRLLARPLRELRRRLLVLLGVRRGQGRVDTEAFVEHALRRNTWNPSAADPVRRAA